MSTFTTVGTFQVITCGLAGCHQRFALAEDVYEDLKKTHATFWCPSGHPRCFGSESEEERLKRQLVETQRNLTAEKCVTVNLRTSLQATQVERGRQARLKREAQHKLKRVCIRIHNGVCPCCKRSFSDLRRHMASKHPTFKNQ